MNELSDALADCLRALEQGQRLETVLKAYPNLEAELRPLLEVSALARSSRQLVILENVKSRGRKQLLQRASEMRESKRISSRRIIPIFPRAAIALALVGLLVLTSTGIVSASSGALPGDQLYPVKRTWEGLQLFFVSSPEQRDALESEFDQERLNEIDELLGKKQTAPITFTGLVSTQADGRWLVSGIPVLVSAASLPSATVISDGAPVTITGTTRSDGVVQAQAIQLLQPGGPLPPFEPSENNESNGAGEQEDANVTPTAASAITPGKAGLGSQKSYQFSGVVQSINENVWVINGQTVQLDQAQMTGKIAVGSAVNFEGYFSPGGKFFVTMVELRSAGNSNPHHKDSGGTSSGNSGAGSDNHGQPGEGGGDNGDDSGH